MIYQALDIFYSLLHLLIVLFNMFGWISVRARKLHLYSVTVTLFSWIGLGAFYGWGYCFLTDWHFEILQKLGETDLPHSYITYMIDRFLGIEVDNYLVMDITALTFAMIVVGTYSYWIYVKFSAKNKGHV